LTYCERIRSDFAPDLRTEEGVFLISFPIFRERSFLSGANGKKNRIWRVRQMSNMKENDDMTILKCNFWEHPEWVYGSNDKNGVYNMIKSAICNSLHEHLLDHAHKIEIVKHWDGSFSVIDNGQGLQYADAKKVFLQLDVETGKKEALAKVIPYPIYTQGMGLYMLNNFSDWLIVSAHHHTGSYDIQFEDGLLDHESPLYPATKKHGTAIRFKPHDDIFTDTNVSVKELNELAKDLCAVFPRLSVSVSEETTPNQYVATIIRFPNGVRDFLLEALGTTPHGPIQRKTWNGQVRDGGIDDLYDLAIEIVLCESTEPKMFCFHNHKPIPEGYWDRHSGDIAEARLYSNKKLAVVINTVSSKASYTTGDKLAVWNVGIVKAVRELLFEAIAEM